MMNENQKVNAAIIVNQLEVAQTLASATFPNDHPVRIIVESTLKNLKFYTATSAAAEVAVTPLEVPPTPTTETAAPVPAIDPVVDESQAEADDKEEDNLNVFLNEDDITIAGLTPNDFMQVLEEVPEDLAETLTQELLENEDAEIGINGVIEKDGEYVEIGNWDENVAQFEAVIAEEEALREEEYGEPFTEPEHAIRVTYTRLDGENLTEDDVAGIIEHRVSAPLFKLGKLHLNRIIAGDTDNVRIAEFEIENPTRSTLIGLALGAVQYRGIKVFPGIGQVEARGSVNFEV